MVRPIADTARDWNYVYVPYCTGDVHTGNNVITYSDPAGVAPDVMFHHAGHANAQAVIGWIDDHFTHVPKLLSTGCSAGGDGALTNYRFLRNGVSAAEQGYLLDDSGPIFPSTSLYSYERFYDSPPKDEIHRMWEADTQLLVQQYDTRDNLAYYIPYWRNLNDSHCTTVVTFTDSDIEERGLTLDGWLRDLLDDGKPLTSAIEAPVPG